jgi:hypothetical protein
VDTSADHASVQRPRCIFIRDWFAQTVYFYALYLSFLYQITVTDFGTATLFQFNVYSLPVTYVY